MIALLEARRAGLFARAHWLPNLVAGLIVAIVALPLAMAFAIASGVRPEQGLYTAIVAGFVVAAFGGSRLQIAGPTGAFVVILAGVTAKYGVEGLQLATLMAGVILIALGLAKFGAVIKFIPAPVIVGFTCGIGCVIFVGQWRSFFGLPEVPAGPFHEQLASLLLALPQLSVGATAIAVASFATLVIAPRVPGLSRVPAPLVALLVGSVAAALWPGAHIATIGSEFGGITPGLPDFHWPRATPAQALELIQPAFTIAMLGAIESMLSAVVADGMAGTKHDSNQELVGQGLANVLSPLFGGFAATGAIARTATNVRSGGTGPIAGIAHAAILVLVLLFLAPFADYVPLATLAAILWLVAYNMSDVHQVARILRSAPPADVAILIVTFLLTVFVDLVVAVNVGIILAILQFLRRMATSIEVRTASHADLAAELGAEAASLPHDIQVYSIQGPLFFAAVDTFERALAHTHTVPKALILRLHQVPFMDYTGLHMLDAMIKRLRKHGVVVVLSEANARVLRKLQRADIVRPEDAHYDAALAGAMQRARQLAAA